MAGAGALNHALEGQFGTAWNDLVTSFENLLGRATSEAEKLALGGITTLKNDLATPLGQAAVTAIDRPWQMLPKAKRSLRSAPRFFQLSLAQS